MINHLIILIFLGSVLIILFFLNIDYSFFFFKY